MVPKDSYRLLLIMLFVMFTHAVRVYEDDEEDQEGIDISGNSNSTGPVLYPETKNTSTIDMDTDAKMKDDQPPSTKKPKLMENQIGMYTNSKRNTSSTESITLKDNVFNQTSQRTEVKENSSLKQRQSYQVNTKPFVSSPKDITTRMAQEGKILNIESFQPMIEKPFQPSEQLVKPLNSAAYKKYHPTPPRSQIEEPLHSQSHFSTVNSKEQELIYNHAAIKPQLQEPFLMNPGREGYIRHQEHKHNDQQNMVLNNSEKKPDQHGAEGIDYEQFQRNFFPKDSPYKIQQQPKYNSLQEFIKRPPSEGNAVAWPESPSTDENRSPSVWTTEQPDFQTHPIKYIPSPTEYEAPKGFLSSALSMLTKSFKPSIPTHPYPFQLTEQPKSYFSSTSEYQFPTSSHGNDHSDHKTYEKYEIITTSSPEYHFLSKPPSESGVFQDAGVAMPPHHHNLPWHKIIKVLTAIIPIGLLVSALTPNVVLINPNATSPHNRPPIGNIFSYVTRQRSLEPEDAFNERIMEALDGLLVADEDSNTVCVRQAICDVIDATKFDNLTPDEYSAFKNKMCNNRRKVTSECNQS